MVFYSASKTHLKPRKTIFNAAGTGSQESVGLRVNLLWKTHFGPFLRSFSLNMPNIRLKRSKKWTQNDFPSLRLPKSDRLLSIKKPSTWLGFSRNRTGESYFILPTKLSPAMPGNRGIVCTGNSPVRAFRKATISSTSLSFNVTPN